MRKPSEPPEVTVQLEITETPSPIQREAWRRLWRKLLEGPPPELNQETGNDDTG